MNLNHKGLKQKLLVVMAREPTSMNYSFWCCPLFLTSSILIDLSCPLMNSYGKDPDAGKDWRQKEKRVTRMRWLDGITDSMDRNSRRWWWTGRPCALQSMGLQSWTWLSDWAPTHLTLAAWRSLCCLCSIVK